MTIILSDPEYVLRGVSGPVFGRHYRLLSPAVIGRSPESDVRIGEPWVSRAHARLRPTLYGLEIEDLGSTNGTFLNGQRITAAIAGPGDEIAFDQTRFRVDRARVPMPAGQNARQESVAASHRRPAWSLLIGTTLAAVAAALANRTKSH